VTFTGKYSLKNSNTPLPVFATINTKKLITMNELLLPFFFLVGLGCPPVQLAASSRDMNTLPETSMDVTPPVFTNCPSGLVTICDHIDTQNFATFLTTWIVPTATDDSGQATVVQVAGPQSGVTYLPVGVIYTVRYKATDPSGNFEYCTFTIMLDDEPPVVFFPGNLIVCAPATWTLPTATDNCGQVINRTQLAGPVMGINTLSPGTTTVSYRLSDRFANQTICTYTLTLESEPPVFSNCPGNVTVCGPTDPWPIPTATDNCGQVSYVQVAGPVSGVNALVPGVVYTVGYRATDLAGNSATCYFTVSIDGKLPTATCSNQTLTFNGQNSIPLDANTLVTATDDCGIQSIALSPSAITCAQLCQTVPVTATVTDINGNVATCISYITVNGLPCGWSQNPNGVNCPNGSNVGFNPGTNVWTVASTNCYYANPFTTDALAFAQQSLCGDGSVTAQVTSINGNALGWAGLVMRESNAAGAKKAQLITNLSSNVNRREFRLTTGGQSYPQQSLALNRHWLRLERLGNQFSMYVSQNGQTWLLVGSQNIAMNSCIQVGLVATNYQQNSTVTATFANVSFAIGGNNLVTPTDEATVRANDYLPQPDFSIFPNPTTGALKVDLTQYAGLPVRLEVYSLQGQLLQFVELDEVQTALESIDLSDHTDSMYLIRVKSAGMSDVMKRVVLAR